MAFENASYPGYTTEKLVQAKLAGGVPIYWGDPLVYKDFNPRSFINVHHFKSVDRAIEYILQVEGDRELYRKIQKEPLFDYQNIPKQMDLEKFLDWMVWAMRQGKQRRSLNVVDEFQERIDRYKIHYLTFQSSQDKSQYVSDFLRMGLRLMARLIERLVRKTKSLIKKGIVRILFLKDIMRR